MSFILGGSQQANMMAISTMPSFNYTSHEKDSVAAYTLIRMLDNAVDTASSTTFNGKNVYILAQTTQPDCFGDEAGIGGGIISGTVGKEVKPTSGSSSISVDGFSVVQEGDTCTMNNENTEGKYISLQSFVASEKAKYYKSLNASPSRSVASGSNMLTDHQWKRQQEGINSSVMNNNGSIHSGSMPTYQQQQNQKAADTIMTAASFIPIGTPLKGVQVVKAANATQKVKATQTVKSTQTAKAAKSGGQESRQKAYINYSDNWPKASFKDIHNKFTPGAKGELSPDGVKTNYISRDGKYELKKDNENNYFRLKNLNTQQYLKPDGTQPKTGRLKGSEAREYLREQTHMMDID